MSSPDDLNIVWYSMSSALCNLGFQGILPLLVSRSKTTGWLSMVDCSSLPVYGNKAGWFTPPARSCPNATKKVLRTQVMYAQSEEICQQLTDAILIRIYANLAHDSMNGFIGFTETLPSWLSVINGALFSDFYLSIGILSHCVWCSSWLGMFCCVP